MSNQKYTYQEAVALAMQGKTLKTVDSEDETYTLSFESGEIRFEGETEVYWTHDGDEFLDTPTFEWSIEENPGVLVELPDELIHLTNCDWEIVE